MRGRLIPARFLMLIGHLCVVISLLWENETTTRRCLPIEFHRQHLKSYRKELTGGYGASIALIALEFVSFLSGVTMFSPTTALVSTGCHGVASVVLTYFILDCWQCGWFWFIFTFCSVLPSIVDISTETTVINDEPRNRKSEGWTYILVVAGIATTFGSSIPVGYNIGVLNTPAQIIKIFCSNAIEKRYETNLEKKSLEILWSSIVSIFIVGGVIGSCVSAFVADKVGRKGGIFIANILAVSGAVLFVTCKAADSIEMLAFGRLLVGLASGLTTSIVPMYLIEIAPLKLRGSMGVLCPLGVCLGVLFAQIISLNEVLGTPDHWHILLFLFGVPVIFFTPLIIFLPESPKYLMAIKNDYDGAVQALCKIRKKPVIELSNDISELRDESGEDTSIENKWGIIQVLRSKELILPLLLVCLMQAGQQTSGINAVFYYSNSIFLNAGLSEKGAQLGTIGAGIVNFVMAVLALRLLAKYPRRTLALISMSTATVCLLGLCITINLISDVQGMPELSIALVLLYVMFYGLGLGPIPYFIGSELFEVGPRPAAMALGSLCNWGGNFLVGMTFPSLQLAIGPYSFLLFALSTGCLCIFVKIYLPETKGKSPSEVALFFKNRNIM